MIPYKTMEGILFKGTGGVVQTLMRAWPDGLDEVDQVVFITQEINVE